MLTAAGSDRIVEASPQELGCPAASSLTHPPTGTDRLLQ